MCLLYGTSKILRACDVSLVWYLEDFKGLGCVFSKVCLRLYKILARIKQGKI